MKKIILIFCLLPLMVNEMLAQITVTGTVISAEDGEPVPGANVVIRGTTTGTITSLSGVYSLDNVPEDATLVYSFIGMQTVEVNVEGRTEIDVVLAVDALGIEEVVAIGYGSARAADLTAPITTISSADIVRNVTTNAISALQGAVPGVQVINSGAPGAGPDIRVRGIGSMHGAQPLYVVDGMFYNDINWLNPNDIQNISVLKDASAASIYGVRASGGVLMITTKKGTRGEGIIIEYDGYTGVNTTGNLMQMANTGQYSMMLIEAGIPERLQPSIDLWGGTPFVHNGQEYTIPATDTDWYNELLGFYGGTGMVMNHALSVRGGTDRTTYHVGASYSGEEGLFRESDHRWQRVNLRSSLDFMPNDFLDMGAQVNINHNQTRDPGEVWGSMYFAVPVIPSRLSPDEEDFAGVVQAGFPVGPVNNPVAQQYYTQGNFNFNRGLNLDYNVFSNLKFLGDDRLVFRTQFSHRIGFDNHRNFLPAFFIDDKLKNDNSTMSKGFGTAGIWHLDNTLTYRNGFGDHNLTAMAGLSVRQARGTSISGWGANVPGERENYLYFFNAEDPDPQNFRVHDGGWSEVGASYFGRAMYNFRHRYLINATIRADGTDKYTQRWGYFPSFGVGWVVSEEAFMANQAVIDNLKLRASWGRLGNNNVPRESGARAITTGFNQSYVFGGNMIVPGYHPSVFFNTLVWEVTDEVNTGIELITFDYRLSAEIEYFRKVTKDAAIWTSNLMGGGGLIRNQGEILNTGMEFVVNWRDKAGELGYNINANLSTLRNEVLHLGGEPYIMGGSAEFPYRSEPGSQLYSWYGYRVEGVYQTLEEIEEHLDTDVHTAVEPGFLRFEDVNGDGIIDQDDRQHLGANIPSLTYGGQVSLDYRRWDFSTSVYGVYGNKLLNRLRAERGWHPDFNFDSDLFENRWRGPGTSDTHPSAAGLMHAWNMNNNSDFLIEDGSFFRIQNITLGYTIENPIRGGTAGSKIRIRLTAQNPFTTFQFNGFTPEVTGTGEVWGVNPIPRSFILGLNLIY
jgi:TonB-linked SusC/RagA family outer membrane protein